MTTDSLDICEHWDAGRCSADDGYPCNPGGKRCLLARKIKATAVLAGERREDSDLAKVVVERWLYSDYETLEAETGLRREEIAQIARDHYDEIFKDGVLPFPDKVVCRICGRELREITSTHLKTHGVKLSDYVAQFGHIPKQVWAARYREYRRWFQSRPIQIRKRDGRQEPFTRRKIVASLDKALMKRPVDRELIESIADDVERSLRMREGRDIEVREIGDMLLERLRETDEVAYVRYASVFKDVHTAHEFLQEVKGFLNGPKEDEGVTS